MIQMPLTEEELKRIDDEAERLLKRDQEAKPIRKARKEYIRNTNTTLQDLLYNEINGKKMPCSTDIVQKPDNYINYSMKHYALNDCYLLAPLIHLAKNEPTFIMEKLIETTADKNKVKIHLFDPNFDDFECKFGKTKSPPYKTVVVEVTKDEAIRWKSAHKAFWPIVIEIAFAKALSKSRKRDLLSSDFSNRDSVLDGGISSLAYTILTGRQAKIPTGKKTVDKPFEKETYSPQVLELYNKINKCLESKKMVCASFYGKTDKEMMDIGLLTVGYKRYQKEIQNSFKELIEEYKKDPESCRSYQISLLNHFLTNVNNKEPSNLMEEFKKFKFDISSPKQQKALFDAFLKVVKLVDKIPKNYKTGIYRDHAYCVVGCKEYDGYKYVIIANPHGTMTKIDYTHKIEKLRKEGKLLREIKTPQDIDNEHGECAMELNHFYKKLDSIEYEYDPEEESYEALREMFK